MRRWGCEILERAWVSVLSRRRQPTKGSMERTKATTPTTTTPKCWTNLSFVSKEPKTQHPLPSGAQNGGVSTLTSNLPLRRRHGREHTTEQPPQQPHVPHPKRPPQAQPPTTHHKLRSTNNSNPTIPSPRHRPSTPHQNSRSTPLPPSPHPPLSQPPSPPPTTSSTEPPLRPTTTGARASFSPPTQPKPPPNQQQQQHPTLNHSSPTSSPTPSPPTAVKTASYLMAGRRSCAGGSLRLRLPRFLLPFLLPRLPLRNQAAL